MSKRSFQRKQTHACTRRDAVEGRKYGGQPRRTRKPVCSCIFFCENGWCAVFWACSSALYVAAALPFRSGGRGGFARSCVFVCSCSCSCCAKKGREDDAARSCSKKNPRRKATGFPSDGRSYANTVLLLRTRITRCDVNARFLREMIFNVGWLLRLPTEDSSSLASSSLVVLES